MTSNPTIKILFLGDISARPGRHAVRDILPQIKKENAIDLVIANCENAAGGRGVTREILNELQGYGIDYFTAGEHIWDREETKTDLQDLSAPLVRPYNYERTELLPGKGWDIIDLGSKGRVVVTCLLGQEFMKQKVKNPFWAVEDLLKEIQAKVGEDIKQLPLIIDFHAEASAEKASFAWSIKENAVAVLGTHTHVGTVDTKILPRKDPTQGCAYVTDVGMCGVKFASLWVDFDSVIPNFKYPFKKKFKVEMKGARIFNSVLLEIENFSAKKITRLDREVK